MVQISSLLNKQNLKTSLHIIPLFIVLLYFHTHIIIFCSSAILSPPSFYFLSVLSPPPSSSPFPFVWNMCVLWFVLFEFWAWYTVDRCFFDHVWLRSGPLTMVHCGQVFLWPCLAEVLPPLLGRSFLSLDLGNSPLWFYSLFSMLLLLFQLPLFAIWSLRLGLLIIS